MSSRGVPRETTRARESRAWELRVREWDEQAIADQLERDGLGRVTQQAVSKMLRRVEARELKRLSERVEGWKLFQSEALLLVYREAIAAWERSKEPHKCITRKVATNDLGAMDPVPGAPIVMTVRDSAGDPRHLAEARAALADLRKLWGLDAPTKIAPTTPDGDKEWNDPELEEIWQQFIAPHLPPLGPRTRPPRST